MAKEPLAVWTAGKPAGVLGEAERFVFTYHTDVQQSDAVSLTMPVRLESWTHRTLHPVFQMNLPEGALLEAIRSAIAKIASPDDLTLLRVVGTHQIGRNRFTKMGEELSSQQEPAETLKDILQVKDSEKLFADLLTRYALRSGVSGVQPKILLETDDRSTIHSSSWIVKASGNDYPYLAANEYYCMSAVQGAGLKVSEFHLSDDGRLFVMKRFDLDADGEFLGFEDFCALQGLDTRDKYSGSYEKAVRTIDWYVSPAHRMEARKQFFTTIVLSVILRNGDAHFKNFGILYPDSESEDKILAPVYDIVTTVAYIAQDIPALTIDGSKKWWDRKTLIRFANTRCGMAVSAANQIVELCLDAVNKQYSRLQRAKRKFPQFEQTATSMLAAWKEGLKL